MSAAYLRYLLACGLSRRLPRRAALGLAERLTDRWWARSARDRAAVASNLSWMLRTAPDPLMSREVFRHFGRYLVEFFTMDRESAWPVDIEGDEHLQAARRAGRGVIILSGHLGNWEMGAAAIRRMGVRIGVVALRHADRRVDRLFNRQRARCGIEVIPLGAGAAQHSLARLREGWMIGLVGDREFGTNGMAATLCGHPVTLPRGPAILSLRSRAPMVPTFLLREAAQRFRLVCEPPIWPDVPHGAVAGAVERLMGAYAAVLERYLTRVPTQWLMFQPLT